MRARIPFLVAVACLPSAAGAAPVCVGFLNQTEQGFKIEGQLIEPSGPKVTAGTELEFNGFMKAAGRLFLTRARSDVIFEADHVELPESCNLPLHEPPLGR